MPTSIRSTNRPPSSNARGAAFDFATVDAVWNKAPLAGPCDPAILRRDACGAFIARARYGCTTELGWEIDHIKPVSKGGGDELANLQPLQWENNRRKGDDWPQWSCAVPNRCEAPS